MTQDRPERDKELVNQLMEPAYDVIWKPAYKVSDGYAVGVAELLSGF